MTTNALGLTQTAPALADGRARPGQRQPGHVRPGLFRDDHPPRPLADVVAGLEAAKAAGLGPVKVNAVLLRGINDDQAPELLRVVHGARLRAAVHRADAAGRPARVDP